MGTATNQIFFDPKGTRSRIFVFLCISFAVAFIVVTASLIRSIIIMPRLPALQLQQPKNTLGAIEKKANAPHAKERGVDLQHNRHPMAGASVNTKHYGFLVPWDDNSFASLKRNSSDLDVVIGEWLHLEDAGGQVSTEPQQKVKPVIDWIGRNAPHIESLPLVNNYAQSQGGWQGAMAAAMMASASGRSRFISELWDYAIKYSLPGVVLDLEGMPATANADFKLLVQEAATLFHESGMKLLVAVPVGKTGLDYSGLAEVCEGLILMAYDQHSDEGEAGPIAGQAWFENQLDDIFKDIEGAKLIVGIGSYGYDWSQAGAGRDITVQDAWDLLNDSGADLDFDAVSLNPTFSYHDDRENKDHVVWFLDAVTAYNQIAAALAMEPQGVALWRLGSEDPNIWAILARNTKGDKPVVEQLQKIPPGYDVVYKGEGDILRITSQQKPGKRSLDFEPKANLITSETMISYPSVTTISRWGERKDKVIAISFDDGPDPRFTPKILDILKEKDVKATFFVVGSMGTASPDLLRRIFNEGHDIGNHTFTHPDLSEISSAQVDLELNATQRLFEATIGISTHLFRPPYARDMQPETVDQAQALTNATALGYTTIGFGVDPLDWALPTTNELLRRTLAQVSDGSGNIILLHDAGGERKATVEALPLIIDALRAQGYRFVPLHELLGVDRRAVMPETSPNNPVMAKLNAIAFDTFRRFNSLLAILLVSALILGSVRLVLVTMTAIVHRRREGRRRNQSWAPSSVAVIVPAYNEEKVICGSVQAILASTFSISEVIVVDDGSSDGTADLVRETFRGDPRVRLISKPNGGKASAINFGLAQTQAEIIILMDADTLFGPDAVGLLVRHFEDESVGAVAGSITVGNRINVLTRFQALEYITSQNLDRRALEMVNGITVVPGAIGAWRRSALLEIGSFATNTLAEDSDATITLERLGWKVLTEPRAIARTEAPETMRAFLRQRLRWMFGTLQVAYKHRDVVLKREASGVAYAALPNILLFQFLLTLISPVIDLMLLFMVIGGIRNAIMHPDAGMSESMVVIISYWMALQMLELGCVAVAFLLSGRQSPWHLLPLIPVQRFCYRQLISWVAIKTAVAAVRGRLMGWGKLKRSGGALQHMPVVPIAVEGASFVLAEAQSP